MTTTVKNLRHFKLTKNTIPIKSPIHWHEDSEERNLFDCFTFWKAKQLALLHVQLRNQHSQFDIYNKDKEKCICSLGDARKFGYDVSANMQLAPVGLGEKQTSLTVGVALVKMPKFLWFKKNTKIRGKALHLAWWRLWPSSILFWTNIKIGPTSFWSSHSIEISNLKIVIN